MDENQFRILIRTLETMARALAHLVALMEKNQSLALMELKARHEQR